MFRSLVPALLVACLMLSGCTGVIMNGSVLGSGSTVTLVQDVSEFSRLQVSNAFKVEVTQADTYSVEIEIDDNLQKYLEVTQRGDTVSIRLRPGLSLTLRNNMLARVTMPELTGLELSGACRGHLSGFKSDRDLEIELSGASTLDGDISAGDTKIQLSGASNATLTGSAGKASVDVSGASRANLADFTMKNTRVDASGASNATVTVNGTLDLDVSGASRVLYLGDAKLGRVNVSGASTVGPK